MNNKAIKMECLKFALEIAKKEIIDHDFYQIERIAEELYLKISKNWVADEIKDYVNVMETFFKEYRFSPLFLCRIEDFVESDLYNYFYEEEKTILNNKEELEKLNLNLIGDLMLFGLNNSSKNKNHGLYAELGIKMFTSFDVRKLINYELVIKNKSLDHIKNKLNEYGLDLKTIIQADIDRNIAIIQQEDDINAVRSCLNNPDYL